MSNPENEKPIDFETLLPSNRTTFERAFEEGVKDLVQSDDIYSWLLDPQQTRLDLLDYLAKEAGVIDWYGSDLETDRRRTVELAPVINRQAGTVAGLKHALESLGCRATITKSERPYELQIYNLVTDKVLTVALQERLYQRVESYKSERDIFTMVIGRLFEGHRHKSAQVSIARKIKISAGGH